MNNQRFLWLVLLCLVFSGCYKDQDNSEPPVTTIEIPDVKINTNIYGVLVDKEGTALTDYDISINDQSKTINQDLFKLNLERGNKKNQHISIVKDNREIAFANVSLIENDYNKIQLTSFPEWNVLGSLSANDIIIENDQLEVKLNNAQSENLSIGTIDQEAALKQIGHWGRNTETESYYLSPISAFYYKNDLKDNTISTTYLGSISNETNVGLFHLDNNFHQWVLIKQLNADNLIVESNKQGYYMLANYTSSSFVEGIVLYDQLPVSFQNIDLATDLGQDLSIQTTASGRWASFVPKESELNLTLKNQCNEPVSSPQIFSPEVGTQILTELNDTNSNQLLPLKFKLVDCHGITSNYPEVSLDFGAKRETYLFEGNEIQTVIASCGDFTIAGLDIDNQMQGGKVGWNDEVQDELGVLSSCNASQQGYSYMKINDEVEILPSFALSQNGEDLLLSAQDNSIRLKIRGNDIGSYMENQVNIFIDDQDFGKDGYFIGCENSNVGCGINDCYVSHLENMNNGQSRITFSGVLWMQTINNPTAGNYPIEGQIIIKQ